MKSIIKSVVVHSSALEAAIFVLVGCQKSIDLEEELPIRFALSVEDSTKGELINTDGSDKALADKGVTSFKTSAYNGSIPLFINEAVNYSTCRNPYDDGGTL